MLLIGEGKERSDTLDSNTQSFQDYIQSFQPESLQQFSYKKEIIWSIEYVLFENCFQF